MADMDELIRRRGQLLAELASVRGEIKRIKAAQPKKPSPNAPGAINLERYRDALRLRNEGCVYREVGKRLNVTGGRARSMVIYAKQLKAAGRFDSLPP